jgi:hypothetical protein
MTDDPWVPHPHPCHKTPGCTGTMIPQDDIEGGII